MRNVIVGCAGIILGIVIGALLLFGANLLMPSRAPNASIAIAPSQSHGDLQSDVSITANPTYVNAQLQQIIKQGGVAKQATISFAAPNLIRVAMVVETTFLGARVTVNATATTRMTVQNNRIGLRVEKIEAAGITVPQSLVASTAENLRAQVEEQLNRLVQKSLQGTGLGLTNVFTTENDITFQFKNAP